MEQLIYDYHLPQPTEVPDLNMKVSDLVCLVLVPWDHLVRTSCHLALRNCELDPRWGVPTFHNFMAHALPLGTENYMTQFIQFFAGAIHMDEHHYLLDVFQALPHTPTALSRNWPLQVLAFLTMSTLS